MSNDPELRQQVRPSSGAGSVSTPSSWEPPRFEVIPLDCEITAYAPDGDLPLF